MPLVRTLATVAAVALVAACASDAPPEPAPPLSSDEVEAAAATITADELRARIGVMAHDSMMGRDTPSPGLEATAAWIAAEFERMGLTPGTPEGFLQRYPIRTIVLDREASHVRLGTASLEWGADVMPVGFPPEVDHTGALVLVSGNGELTDSVTGGLAGRHALLMPGTGSGADRQALVRALRGSGAAAVWLIDERDDGTWEMASGRALRPRTSMPDPEDESVPVLAVRADAFAEALAAVTLPAELFAPREGDLTLHVLPVEATVRTVATVSDETTAPNVVAVLEGSDPTLRSEYVLYSAHMDHVGTGRPDARGDSIYNGADDDASGTAAVMEIAEAMAALPRAPRRSQVFVLVSGEEKGLWGSAWFAAHPTVPLESVVANLNADMVGRNWSDTIVVIGKEHSDLGATLEEVNAARPELGMTAIDDLWPDQNFYRRSDHFNFARRGVPILFFFNGTHEDYHRPSDEVDLIDADKAARIGRLMFYLGVEVSDRDARPAWDPDSRREIVDGGGAP